MVGRAYKRLVNNIVQSLKPVYGKKPYRNIIVTLANIIKSHNAMQLQVDKTLKIIFFSQKKKQITEYNKIYR